jgi:hypothetical protein
VSNQNASRRHIIVKEFDPISTQQDTKNIPRKQRLLPAGINPPAICISGTQIAKPPKSTQLGANTAGKQLLREEGTTEMAPKRDCLGIKGQIQPIES